MDIEQIMSKPINDWTNADTDAVLAAIDKHIAADRQQKKQR